MQNLSWSLKLKVIAARRITLKKDGKIVPTRHVILTFNTPVLPSKITAVYISCDIRPCIPNPVRCFTCQRFGHTKTACRGSSAFCARCSEPEHEKTLCTKPEKLFNCKDNHPSYSKSCPKWKLEKEIQTVKITKKISIQEARKIVLDGTPKPNYSYTAALKITKTPDTHIEPSQAEHSVPTETKTPKFSTSKIENVETITVKLSDWLSLLEAHKGTLENEQTNDRKQDFLNQLPTTNEKIKISQTLRKPIQRDHIEQRHLDELIRQLPSSFFLLGHFNGHNTLWGSTDTNPRGRQIETLIEDHCLCLLNDNSYMHFHEASQTFHTIDLAICSPTLAPYWKLSTSTNLFNSDHFPIGLTYIKKDLPFLKRPVKCIFSKADWLLFESLCQLTPDMVDKKFNRCSS
ncbi:hypothetical protein AVEN_165530-1 [Araneus ventricosus]|uniref:Endonuclease/exonuclease/phosphatase domain-containing protein n=1 Tax=Araneus ventricosus TaxID=182803 RepID=A0A4Y2N7X2_ARAVE|nr:hypothetical protein AVEN_165530-1 [Araneus ventricosus]